MKALPMCATTICALVAGTVVVSEPVRAQVTEISRTPIADAAQLTFGYLCDDKFIIRNDGTQAVALEYAVSKGTEHITLMLGARETVELASASKQPLELWKDGKLVAKAEKQKRSCKNVQGNAQVTVQPLDVASTDQNRRSPYGYGFGAGYGAYPFFDPWFGGFYGSLAFSPYFGGGFRGAPIVIVRGGGRRGR